MLVPQQVPGQPWRSLHFNAGGATEEDIAEALSDAIQPLTECRIQFTYFKPEHTFPQRSAWSSSLNRTKLTLACSVRR